MLEDNKVRLGHAREHNICMSGLRINGDAEDWQQELKNLRSEIGEDDDSHDPCGDNDNESEPMADDTKHADGDDSKLDENRHFTERVAHEPSADEIASRWTVMRVWNS